MKSVLNALRVVEEVAECQPIGVAELSRRLGIPKTSVQRALETLGEAGWLRREHGGLARWSLSARTLALGRASANRTLRDLALGTMSQLRAETGETILFFVRDGDQVTAIEGLDGIEPVRAHAGVGTRAPLHASASGKAILAELPDDDVEAYVAQGLVAQTETGIAAPRALRSELDRIRKRGYATSKGEWLRGVTSVGAPICGPDGRVEGAIVIAAPSDRVGRARLAELGERVSAAAKQISSLAD